MSSETMNKGILVDRAMMLSFQDTDFGINSILLLELIPSLQAMKSVDK